MGAEGRSESLLESVESLGSEARCQRQGHVHDSFIVQVALGDLPHGSIEYQSIFAVGLVLVLMTLLFNVLGHMARMRFREIY